MQFLKFVILALASSLLACGGSAPTNNSSGTGGQPTAKPGLYFTFDGPPSQDVDMGTKDASLFCFSLAAVGHDYGVRLPPMRIQSADGSGFVITNSLLYGDVFESPRVTEGTNVVIPATKDNSILNAGKTIALDGLSLSSVSISQSTTRHLCVQADVVAWSASPNDFFDRPYDLVMGEWGPQSVLIQGTSTYLPREQIFAPAEASGNLITIGGNPHTELYNGILHVQLDQATPLPQTVHVGQKGVLILSFDLAADGTGACVRGEDLTYHGVNYADVELFDLYDVTSVQSQLYSAAVNNGKVTFGWHAYGLLFCLPGGEQHHYMVTADISSTAVINDQLAIGIDNPPQDIDRVIMGAVQGPSFLSSTFTIVP